jgi:hypothetical protein
MADTAYDADHLRQAIAAKGRSLSSPTTRHVRSNIRSTSISMPSAISWNAASQNSSSSAASQPALRLPELPGRRHSRSHHLIDAISVHTTWAPSAIVPAYHRKFGLRCYCTATRRYVL